MEISMLNVALKQPLPTELSALFMYNILQRRQHKHFAGQASADSHLQLTFFLFPRLLWVKKPSLLSLLVLNLHLCVCPRFLVSGYKCKCS